MSRDFYAAALPEPTVILGLPLLPLSLGHRILLNRMESVFMVGGAPTMEHLAVSLVICSQTYEDALTLLEDPDLPTFMHRWHEKVTGGDTLAVRFGFRKQRAVNFVGACEAFGKYLSDNSTGPNYKYDEARAQPLAFPYEQLIKVALMRGMHLPETEVLNRSWLMCLWDHAVLLQLDGAVEIVDDQAITDALDIGRQLAEALKDGKLKLNGNRS